MYATNCAWVLSFSFIPLTYLVCKCSWIVESTEYRGSPDWLFKVKDELLRAKNPNYQLEFSSSLFTLWGTTKTNQQKKNPKETAALVSGFIQDKGSMLNHE